MTDPDPREDLPAGLPSARSNQLVYIGVGVVCAIPFIALIAYMVHNVRSTTFADEIGELAVSADVPAETKLALRAGDPLIFAVSTSYSYSGNPSIMLSVSLMRDGTEVAAKECNMKGFTGFGASGSGSNLFYGDAGWTCGLDVPAGGATAVGARVWKGGKGALELSHTSVIVKRP